MSPKEKARELTTKFSKVFEYTDSDTDTVETDFYVARECAIIAVDELIEVAKEHPRGSEWSWWAKVKEEINNL